MVIRVLNVRRLVSFVKGFLQIVRIVRRVIIYRGRDVRDVMLRVILVREGLKHAPHAALACFYQTRNA